MPESDRPTHILDRIVATKREEVERIRDRVPDLRSRAEAAPHPRDFAAALSSPDHLELIAEVKRRSPGAGAIRPDLDPVSLARSYARGGASALSILTDGSYFEGSIDDLSRVRESVEIPCLRKDFILDESQIWEARAAGADAILLIVRILDDESLRGFRELAQEMGMTALVEAHDADELERAIESGAGVIGINNRDLATFRTDLDVTLDLMSHVPSEVILVSESGVRTGDDARRLADAGVDAILVGEALVRAEDPVALADELTPPRRSRSGR